MTTYWYDARPVVDPISGGSVLVPNADFTVHAYADTALATPLTVQTRLGGVLGSTSELHSTPNGILDEFSVEDEWRVWLKSGEHVVLHTSTQGLADAADASRVAAEAAQGAAESAAAIAETATAATTVQINTHLGGDATNLVNIVAGKADLDPVTGKVVATQLPATSGTSGLSTTELNTYLGGDSSNLVVTVSGKANDASVVHKTTDELVAGVKTFTSAPVVPTGSFALTKIATTGATANQVVAYNGTALAYRTPDVAMLPAGSTAPAVFQNSDGTWPVAPSARTDLMYLWVGYPARTELPTGVSGALLNTYRYRAA